MPKPGPKNWCGDLTRAQGPMGPHGALGCSAQPEGLIMKPEGLWSNFEYSVHPAPNCIAHLSSFDGHSGCLKTSVPG